MPAIARRARVRLFATALIAALIAAPAQLSASDRGEQGEHSVATGRYERTRTAPLEVQADPLSALVEVRLDAGLHSVGEAMQSLLQGTGYRLVDTDPRVQLLMKRPLASVQRFLGPIRVRQALRTLAGAEWDLLQDPVHRLVSFELLPPWNELLAAPGEIPAAGDARLPHRRPERSAGNLPQRLFRVRPGSLKNNIERLVRLWRRKLVGWDLTLNDGQGVLDWQLHTGWMLSASSLEQALTQILQPHVLRAVLHERDGSVSVYRTQP